MKTKTTASDCKPTIVRGDTLMSGEGVFITDVENAKRHCIKDRCCDNIQICLAMKEKLDRNKTDEVLDMLDDLY